MSDLDILMIHFAMVQNVYFWVSLLTASILCLFLLQFSHMIKLYHSLGPDKFPLNEQTFYSNHMQMVSAPHLLQTIPHHVWTNEL